MSFKQLRKKASKVATQDTQTKLKKEMDSPLALKTDHTQGRRSRGDIEEWTELAIKTNNDKLLNPLEFTVQNMISDLRNLETQINNTNWMFAN